MSEIGKAVVEYIDSIAAVAPGAYVRCVVTGREGVVIEMLTNFFVDVIWFDGNKEILETLDVSCVEFGKRSCDGYANANKNGNPKSKKTQEKIKAKRTKTRL